MKPVHAARGPVPLGRREFRPQSAASFPRTHSATLPDGETARPGWLHPEPHPCSGMKPASRLSLHRQICQIFTGTGTIVQGILL